MNGLGEAVRLRGFCLGGWLNMENFMTGFPGEDQWLGSRAALPLAAGSAHLRTGFYQAALVAVKCDPHLRAYHRRRVRQGLPARPSPLSVARKLARISYALLKSGQPYPASPAASPDLENLCPVCPGSSPWTHLKLGQILLDFC